MPYSLLLLCDFTLSALLTGLIWTVQLVHYPGFSNVGADKFSEYEALHRKRIFPLVGPLMVAELGVTAWLLLAGHAHTLHLIAAVLLMIIWVHTWTVAAPAHFKLERQGHSAVVIRELVRSNWIRTLSWTSRTVICGYLIYGLMTKYS